MFKTKTAKSIRFEFLPRIFDHTESFLVLATLSELFPASAFRSGYVVASEIRISGFEFSAPGAHKF